MGNRRGAARTDRATEPRKRSARAPVSDGPARTDPIDPRAKARQICLDLLTTKARTRAELATALARRGIDEDTVSDVLARFSEVGLIDDAAFAESFVHAGHNYRGLGRRALAAQLRRRGVDEQTTDTALAAVDPHAEEEMARTLVRRRLAGGAAGADEVATIRKLVGVLARRGYPEGLSYRVVRDELRAAGRDAGPLDDLDLG
ncbi:MAG TPA: regulatory protein RecX [Pseudonocardiaceae bacterium]|jgi:regulatory protein